MRYSFDAKMSEQRMQCDGGEIQMELRDEKACVSRDEKMCVCMLMTERQKAENKGKVEKQGICKDRR